MPAGPQGIAGPVPVGTIVEGTILSTSDTALIWQRSRRCENGQCVEVAKLRNGVALRESTRPDGPALRFSTTDWNRFLTDLRAGVR